MSTSAQRTGVGFALCVAGAFAVAYLDAGRVLGDRASDLVLRYALESLYVLLPATLGIAMAATGVHLRRVAAWMTAATVLGMVALDFAPGASMRIGPETDLVRGASGEMYRAQAPERWNSAGALRVLGAYVRGGYPGADDLTPIYDADAPRLVVAHAVLKLSFLLIPVAIAGAVLGAFSWIDHAIVFTSRASETVVEFVMGWVLGPAILGLATQMAIQVLSMVFFDAYPIWAIVLPYLALALLSGVGWWFATPTPRD